MAGAPACEPCAPPAQGSGGDGGVGGAGAAAEAAAAAANGEPATMAAGGQRRPSGALGRDEYSAIVAKLERVPAMACPNWRLVRRQHPSVPMETLLALFSQEAQYRVIRTHHLHKAGMAAYCARYRAGADVLELCAAADFPPCLMMRRMLEHMLCLSKQRASDALRDPSLLVPGFVGAADPGADGGDLLARLRADIARCARADRSYSPFSDVAKGLAGLEHEEALYEALAAAGVAHWSETDLRERGMYKTPDALLQVPIAVRCPLSGRWHIVHWIDSKACFGDDRLHAQALEGQYRTYLNRYGSGAVIYWLGFVTALAGVEAGPAAGQGGGSTSDGVECGREAGALAGSGGGTDAGEVLLLERFPDPSDMRMLVGGPSAC